MAVSQSQLDAIEQSLASVITNEDSLVVSLKTSNTSAISLMQQLITKVQTQAPQIDLSTEASTLQSLIATVNADNSKITDMTSATNTAIAQAQSAV